MAAKISRQELDALLDHVREWAITRSDIRAVALLGSYARGTPHEESDIDVHVLTTNPSLYIDHDDWVIAFDASLVATESWGAITSRRLIRADGIEIEVGIGERSWAATDPLDDGTRQVARDGLRIVHDPDGILRTLQSALDA